MTSIESRPLYAALYAAQRGCCFHCLLPMAPQSRRHRSAKGWTREHVLPLCKGGGNLGNVVLAHYRCNNRRAAAPLDPIDIRRARLIIAAISVKLGQRRPLPGFESLAPE